MGGKGPGRQHFVHALSFDVPHVLQSRRRARHGAGGEPDGGAGAVVFVRDHNGNGWIDDFDRLLPISERFFSGGSTTLRGFPFEEAGPRQVIVPEGQFRNSEGDVINLDPFTVPIGGNARS